MMPLQDMYKGKTDPGSMTIMELNNTPPVDARLHPSGGVEMVPFSENIPHLVDRPLTIRRAGPLPKG